MKFAKIILTLSLLLSSFCLQANYGCYTGSTIYPNATGGVNGSGDPYYYNSEPITLRTWDGDTRCGIRDNKVYQRTNGDDNCQIVAGNWGTIWYYNPADNNCVPLPLDDYIWVMILAAGGIGYYILKKNKLALSA
jgi:hypothetical protein